MLIRLLLAAALALAAIPARAVNYDVNAYERSAVWVSTVSANGIPVGSDSGATGGQSDPYATCDYALTHVLGASPIIYFNGVANSPTTYICSPIITSTVTLQAVVAGGAAIAGPSSGASFALRIGPASGGTITLKDIIIDPSLNTAGAANVGLQLDSKSTPYTVTLNNATVQKFLTYGIAPTGNTWKGVINLTNTTITDLGSSSAGLYAPGIDTASSVTISGGSCTQAAQTAEGFACIFVTGGNAGTRPFVTVTNMNCNSTLDPSLYGTVNINYCLKLQDVQADVEGGTYISACGAATAHSTEAIIVTPQGVNFFGIGGSIVKNVQAQNLCPRGALVIMGTDSLGIDPVAQLAASQNLLVDGVRNDIVGVSTGGEGIVLGYSGNSTIQNSYLLGNAALSLAWAAKGCITCSFLNNYGEDIAGATQLYRGNTNTVERGNTLKQTALTTGRQMLRINLNTETGNTPDTGVYGPSTYIDAGGTNSVFISQNATSTPTYNGNTYTFSSGSISGTGPFQIGATNYANCTAFTTALDPTGICNGF